MKRKGCLLITALALLALLQFAAGCAAIKTKIPRFYVLSPMQDLLLEKETASSEAKEKSIGIGLVTLPKYLRRPQIVSRTNNNELFLAEFDRWAGKLEEDIGRVVAENLAYLLSNDKIVSYPAVTSVDTDYRIVLDVSRFEGAWGSNVTLAARWVITDSAGKNINAITAAHIEEEIKGDSYAAMVAAQSRALALLSREIAGIIKKTSAE